MREKADDDTRTNAKIAEALQSKGHSVTMLLPQVDDKVHFNSSTINMLPVPLNMPPGLLRRQLWQNPGPFEDANPLNPLIFLKLVRVSHIFVRACQEIADESQLLRQLQQEQFDVGMVEQYDSCGFGIFQKLNISNVLWISATGAFRQQTSALGIHYPLSYAPELFAAITNQLSFFDRVQNFLVAWVTTAVFSATRHQQSRIFNEDLMHLSRRSNSILLNSNPVFDFPVPLNNQITHLAGITINLQNVPELDKYWTNVADSAINGFVLVSFGSIARTVDMDRKMLQIFFDSFNKFPHLLFILKYEEANCTLSLPDNVLTASWLPQKSLMAHSNYKGIVTHGGLSSILESIMFGKPMVLMPLFADHFKNSNIVLLRNVGLVVDKAYLTQELLSEAIFRITSDERFTQNCLKIASMLSLSAPVTFAEQLNFRLQNSVKFTTTRHQFPRRVRPGLPKSRLFLELYEYSYVNWLIYFLISSCLMSF